MKELIDEMARDICHLNVSCDECAMLAKQTGQSKERYCKAMQYAKRAYEKGWHKQSEWISVTERLPESGASVLGYSEIVGDIRCYDICKGRCDSTLQWWSETGWATVDDLLVTHWMPLPEPPEMKGGAE